MADVATDEERPKLFYYLEIVDYGTHLIIPAIVSVVMPFHIWVPFLVGVFASAVSFVAVLFLPETVAMNGHNRKLTKLGTPVDEELPRSLAEEGRQFLEDISGVRPAAEGHEKQVL
ncbi:hypothetical protein BU24DRAFT_457665 [Aaosphaeria arxii CBS 175.79]|uniref:Uncharacterized protein n=1 Tax=Aaosphaeria arxii CBS 175.79 TaxID=1450172 RepID=A0A6A5Y807_9PLEO|nr:uncharacterized protein BU24DRAFT_457665 [Aaosphaeria arxii CBS 175.79]KAF2021712.1 hypothetical protein BU24DRAFT_457665 [Aaosphaeria arxii CBS 175.79]